MKETYKEYETTYSPTAKIKIFNNQISEIENYGIYDYFNYSDHIFISKMIGAFVNDLYVIETGHGDKCDHYGMIVDIQAKYGFDFDLYVASYGDELNFFAEKKALNAQSIDIILNIIFELKNYYTFSKKNKSIRFIGFPHELKNITNCEQLNELINILKNLKHDFDKEFYIQDIDDIENSNLFI